MPSSIRFGGAGAALALAGMITASAALLAQDKPKPAPATPALAQPAAPAKPAPAKPAATAKPADQAKPAATAPGKGTADRYTATATNLGGVTGETITVDLIRWSTDAEREKVVATLKDKGEKELLAVLQQAPNIGYIWRSG